MVVSLLNIAYGVYVDDKEIGIGCFVTKYSVLYLVTIFSSYIQVVDEEIGVGCFVTKYSLRRLGR